MEKEELLKQLNELQGGEMDHIRADELLLEYINDEDIKKAFDDISKWYA